MTHNKLLTKFRNQYRIPSTRLPEYDYRSDGAYFITICTKHREHFFGKIAGDQIKLSEIGEIIVDEWQKTAEIRSNIQLGEWVVMPNHFHGIIIIHNNNHVETPRWGVSHRIGVSHHIGVSHRIGASNINKWQSGCLGTIVNQFKSICTKRSRIINPKFSWQSRFYEHVIRNEKDYHAIAEYIIFNLQKWEHDENFTQS